MYVRHVDDDEQKIEAWFYPDPSKEVEMQISHILKGFFITLKVIIKLPKDQAMSELGRLARCLIAYTKGQNIGGHTFPSDN